MACVTEDDTKAVEIHLPFWQHATLSSTDISLSLLMQKHHLQDGKIKGLRLDDNSMQLMWRLQKYNTDYSCAHFSS